MAEFKQYRRTQIAEMRPYVPGEVSAVEVSVSAPDREAGSPKEGDMIARNPKNHADQWLVAAQYFADNFEPMPEEQKRTDDYGDPAKGEYNAFLADGGGDLPCD